MSDFADDRREEIIRLVGESGKIQVSHLAELLQVTPTTIRRDLAELEAQGALKRTHGVASLRREEVYAEKAASNHDEKRVIAAAAAKLVKPGDTVFLDAGTTTFEIACLLIDTGGLTVITDDIKIAFLLSHCKDIEVMCCGGMVQKETGSMIGLFANQMVGYVQIDCAFIGAASINSRFNVLTPSMDKVTLKRTVLANAERSFLVADSSKFNRKALMKINNLGDYDGVISTRLFTQEERSRLDRLGVRLIPVGRG